MTSTAAMIGAGLIGRSWAMVFARAGWQVRLYDSDAAQLDAAREHIETGLTEQQAYGLADDAVAAAARIAYVTDLDQALAGVDWVQENTPEVLDVKRELYPRIDRATPATAIVASSTSAIPASRFTEDLRRTRALPGRASGQPAASRAGGRAVRCAVDLAGDDRARARGDDGDRPGADHRQARARRLHIESIAGRAAVRGAAPRRRGLCVAARPRQDDPGRPGAALVVHRTIRDDRAQRAGRRRRLLRAVCWVLSIARGESAFGSIWDTANVQHVASQLEPPPTQAERDARMRWRDLRLLALRQHKRDEPDFN